MDDPKVSSPEATGGAGPGFEVTVGAITLARLLREDRVPGLGLPVSRVRFQQRFAGAELDDVVLEAGDPRGGVRSIEHQIKRTLSLTASDDDFGEIVRRCLAALASDTDAVVGGWRRFGITSAPAQAMKDLDRVCVVARSHDEPEGFLEVIRRTARRGVRDRLDALRTIIVNALTATSVDAATPPDDMTVDRATWRVARALCVWPLDAEPEGADVLATLDRLDDLMSDEGKSVDVFRVLTEAARSWAPQAGAVGVGDLRAHLEAEGVALDAAPRRRRAFETLTAASRPLLDPEAARIGRTFHLPRGGLRREAADAIAENPVVILGGVAGVGKSMLARLAAADLADVGATVVAVSLARRSGGLAELEAEIGVKLADGLTGAPIGDLRVLVIDGGEQALTDGAALLSAVLAAVKESTAHGPSWHIVLTARNEAVGTVVRVTEDTVGVAPQRVFVGELTDEEVDEVLTAFPLLAALGRHRRTRALLLRRPYLVELLVRAVQQGPLGDDVVGEEDLLEVVTDRLVRRDEGGLPGEGAPDARADVYLALAEAAIDNALPVRLDGTDADARAGLASDDVIRRTRASWALAHDVLTDYAVATRLLEGDGDDLLASAPAPRRLLRAVRLRMQRQLADGLAQGQLPSAWEQILRESERLAASDGPRWRDIPWEAVLHLGHVRGALDALTPTLLDHDGAGLIRLIDVTERLARRAVTDDADGPLPVDPALSGPVVDLLTTLNDRVPEHCRLHAARLAHEHLDAASALGMPPDTALDAADLPDVLVGWAGEVEWGDALEHVVGSLGLLGPHLADRHDEFLARHARNRPHEVAEVVESPRATAHLATARADLLLRLAGLYYLGTGLSLTGCTDEVGRRPRRRGSYWSPFDADSGFDDLEFGVRDHDHKQSRRLPMRQFGLVHSEHPELGPFAALLDRAPAHGLRLVGSVVDAATAYRAQVEFGEDAAEHVCTVDLGVADDGQPRRFVGPASVWRWYRGTAVGPHPALSALMALRAWAVRRIRDGEHPAAVRDEILATGDSLAFPAVALSALVDGIDHVTDELDMFLEHPLLWHLETTRIVGEDHMTALDVPDALRLRWPLSNVAMDLVLRADDAGRARLRLVGEALRANHAELRSPDSELLTQRWAAELDIDRYVAEPHDDGLAIRVDYDPGVIAQLAASGGKQALDSLRTTSLMMDGIAIRDGKAPLPDAAAHWQKVTSTYQALDADSVGVFAPGDVLAAAAAALVMAADAGESIDDTALRAGVGILLDAAGHFGELAPPVRGSAVAPTDDDDSDADASAWRRPIADTVWDLGADRSIASALPRLLRRPDLAALAAVSLDDVVTAVVATATSPFYEARLRLVSALGPAWTDQCSANPSGHEAALAAARRLIATSGYGPLDKHGQGHPPATLAEPIEDALTDIDGPLALDIAAASFAVSLLAAGEHIDCEHGRTAAALLDVLIAYDEQVWPREYARHGYHNTHQWRTAIDAALAERILRGDSTALERRLDAFAHVGEELRDLLTLLEASASTAERAERLHDVWPLVLDRLLPDVRDLSPRSRRAEGPYHRHVDELDRALVLVPPKEQTHWPVERTFALGVQWLLAFDGHPAVADRAITFIGRVIGLGNDLAIQMVLRVLGDNIALIRRESRMAVPFLQVVLGRPPEGPGARAARALLDRLAAAGDEWALSVQQALEA